MLTNNVSIFVHDNIIMVLSILVTSFLEYGVGRLIWYQSNALNGVLSDGKSYVFVVVTST